MKAEKGATSGLTQPMGILGKCLDNRHLAEWRLSFFILKEKTYPLICSVRYKKYMSDTSFREA